MAITRLRWIGAGFMGITEPVPSTTTSPMSEQEAAWVRANAWTKGIREIEDAYAPYQFHRWCSCEAGVCSNCRGGHHDTCLTREGPRYDGVAGTITDRFGFVVALIAHRDDQKPCRRICPCTHEVPEPRPAPEPAETTTRHRPADAAGQLTLFPEQ